MRKKKQALASECCRCLILGYKKSHVSTSKTNHSKDQQSTGREQVKKRFVL